MFTTSLVTSKQIIFCSSLCEELITVDSLTILSFELSKVKESIKPYLLDLIKNGQHSTYFEQVIDYPHISNLYVLRDCEVAVFKLEFSFLFIQEICEITDKNSNTKFLKNYLQTYGINLEADQLVGLYKKFVNTIKFAEKNGRQDKIFTFYLES